MPLIATAAGTESAPDQPHLAGLLRSHCRAVLHRAVPQFILRHHFTIHIAGSDTAAIPQVRPPSTRLPPSLISRHRSLLSSVLLSGCYDDAGWTPPCSANCSSSAAPLRRSPPPLLPRPFASTGLVANYAHYSISKLTTTASAVSRASTPDLRGVPNRRPSCPGRHLLDDLDFNIITSLHTPP